MKSYILLLLLISTANFCFAQGNTHYRLRDTSVRFFWLTPFVDSEQHINADSMTVNYGYCKIIPEAVKASVGYVATFIADNCYKEDGNEICQVLKALNLGYQCSDQHLGFLRQWFSGDTTALNKLQQCPMLPYGGNLEGGIDTIQVTVKHDTISVLFVASWFYMPTGEGRSWSETETFALHNNHLAIVPDGDDDRAATINNDINTLFAGYTNFTYKTLKNKEFIKSASKDTGSLTGYYDNGQLVEITLTTDSGSCTCQYTYYLNHDKLIAVKGFVWGIKMHNAPDDTDSTYRAPKTNIDNFEYYYDNGRLIKYKDTFSDDNCSGAGRYDDGLACISALKRYEVLLKNKK